MFPARPIVALDSHPGIVRFKGFPEDMKLNTLANIRTVGLLRQSECLTAYAMEVFVDIANQVNSILKRIKDISERSKALEAKLPGAIEVVKNTNRKFWPYSSPDIPIPKDAQNDDDVNKEFEFDQPQLVKKVITKADPAPDFSAFEAITKGCDPSDPNKTVNFNILHSNPNFVKIQYKQELIDNIRAEQEKKKAEAKARKEKAKLENEQMRSRKAEEKADNQQGSEDLISALASPPPRPTALVCPPSKGKASHGAVPISLQATAGTNYKATVSVSLPAASKPAAPSAPSKSAGGAPPPPPPPPANIPPPPPPPPPPANLPPPPPPPANLPPPPPPSGGGASPGGSAPSTADLLKGGVKLKKVEKPPEPAPAPMTHLDLIKQGGFKLKKVDKSKPLPPPPKPEVENVDPNSLSLQEILARAASIRDAVAGSDDSDEDEESESSSTTW